jgi:Flp pilus assembly protein TadG
LRFCQLFGAIHGVFSSSDYGGVEQVRLVTRCKDSSGVAKVEFAVCIGVLYLFFASIMGYGLLLQYYMSLTRSVHEGVMFAAKHPGLDSSSELVKERIASTLQAYSHSKQGNIFNLRAPSGAGASLTSGPEVINVSLDQTNNTVLVRLETEFSGLLGRSIPLVVEANGPYLK